MCVTPVMCAALGPVCMSAYEGRDKELQLITLFSILPSISTSISSNVPQTRGPPEFVTLKCVCVCVCVCVKGVVYVSLTPTSSQCLSLSLSLSHTHTHTHTHT